MSLATAFARFGKRWASSGSTSEPSDVQADAGLEFLGANPPTFGLHNSLWQWNDDKDNWLFGQIADVIEAAGATPAVSGDDQLLNAVRQMFGRGLQVFIASGNWTIPAGVYRIKVTVVAGGGQGGGATASPISVGSGGGAGGAAIGVFSVVPGTTYAVTVGSGGYSTATGTTGTAGGASSFGALLSATGGMPGRSGTAPIGGNGGVGTGGQINLVGGDGLDAVVISGSNGNYGGTGGGSIFGSSNRSSRQLTGGQAHGVGGAGALQGSTLAGSGGANGIVFVEW